MKNPANLLDWTRDWFYWPGGMSTPSDDRMFCFETVSSLIHQAIAGGMPRGEKRFTFDLLTYLLLGWNPITAWPNDSVFEPPANVEDWSNIKAIFKSLLDLERDHPDHTSSYALLAAAMKEFNRTNAASVTLYEGERVTMLMLALWLLDPKTTTPKKDLGLIRACLDLYYTSYSSQIAESVQVAYASVRTEPNYNAWMVTQVNRLLARNVPTEELFSSVAYLGWFASIVRTRKMMQPPSRTFNWADSVNDILMCEVTALKSTLYNADMRCESEKPREESYLWCAAKLFRMLRWHPITWVKRFGQPVRHNAAASETDATDS